MLPKTIWQLFIAKLFTLKSKTKKIWYYISYIILYATLDTNSWIKLL